MPNKPRFSAQLKDGAAAFYLYDQIGSDGYAQGISPQAVVDALDEMSKAGARVLNVYVNSPGGSVFDGITIYQAIKRWKGEKNVFIDGLAASIASVIAMVGDKIHMAKNAMIMIHCPQGVVVGDASDMRQQADVLDSIQRLMTETYAARTGCKPDDLVALMQAETWLDAESAKKRGFVDEIIGREKDDDEEEDDDEEKEDDEKDFYRAISRYKNAPKIAARLLSRPLPFMKTNLPEETMPEEKAVDTTKFDAKIDRLIERVAELEKVRNELLATTGKASTGEALAAVAGLQEQSARSVGIYGKLARLEAEKKESEIKALLDEAVRDARLTPAKRVEIDEKRANPEAQAFLREPAALRAFLECLPKMLAPQVRQVEGNAPIVTPEIARVAAQLNLDPKTVAARAASRVIGSQPCT